MARFTFEGVCRKVGRFVSDKEIVNEDGVWTDGIGLYSDREPLCAYRLVPGNRYRVTVEMLPADQTG